MDTLQRYSWTSQAIELLQSLHEIPPTESAILFIRHSHRNDGKTWDEIIHLLLTPEGMEGAKSFGEFLPRRPQFRIYYSQVQRCKQTAELIAQGLQENKQTVSVLEELKILGEYLGDNKEIGRLFIRDKRQFMNYWAANFYPADVIEPLTTYSRRTAEKVWLLHTSAQKGTIDIHVTHDTTIMGLEFGWCGLLRNTYSEWVDFLGGFIIQLRTEQIQLIINGKQYSMYYPYWFNGQIR